MSGALRFPEPIDLVDASEVRTLLTQTREELVALEARANEMKAAADAAEMDAREAIADAGAATWTLVRLQRFLGEIRAEAARDAASMIEVARHHARLRVHDARFQTAGPGVATTAATGSVNGTGRPQGSSGPAPTPEPFAADHRILDAVTEPVPMQSVAAQSVAPPTISAEMVVPIPSPPAPAPVLAAPPAPVATVATPPAVPGSPVPPAATVTAPPPPDPRLLVAAAAPQVVSPNGATASPAPGPIAAPPAPTEAPYDDEVWSEVEPKRAAWRGIKVFPLSVILEVVAVLLILGFMLMKLS